MGVTGATTSADETNRQDTIFLDIVIRFTSSPAMDSSSLLNPDSLWAPDKSCPSSNSGELIFVIFK